MMTHVLPSLTVKTCSQTGTGKYPNLASCFWHPRIKDGNFSVAQTGSLRSSWTFIRSILNVSNNAQKSHGLRVFSALQNSVEHMGSDLHVINKTKELQRKSSYLFRTENGGSVNVSVEAKHLMYVVCIEVSNMPHWCSEHKLVLHWRMFRSDSSSSIVLDSQSSAPDASQFTPGTKFDITEVPLIQNSFGKHTLELQFHSAQVPFYLSFLLYSSFAAAGTDASEVRTHRKANFCVPVGLGPGNPMPLGVSFFDDGSVNFSLFSRNAENVVLCLFDDLSNKPSLEIDLDPYVNRTGGIWHASLENVKTYVGYGYRCKGSMLTNEGNSHVWLDPYAKVLRNLSPDFNDHSSLSNCLGCLQKMPSFDWSGDVRLCLPLEKLVVYRLNVGSFTQDASSQLPEDVAGTFSGLVEKVDHFKGLGVNAILLEPIFPFDKRKGPYFPYNFFSPMDMYGPKCEGTSAINSMREMVKAFHANGIEVLLEVVFTHTNDISFQGIDNLSYYVVDGDIGPGVENALNCNSPTVQKMIIDSLRHWVVEFHIDGFCFVNASYFVQCANRHHSARPPLVESIAFDPVLSNTKIIADCWSPVDTSYHEINFPHWRRWAEMNSRFCKDARNFLRGEGLLSSLATRLCGSGDVFSDSRGPAFSFNFIAKNFGLPLVDLVSFSRNKLSSELSWNCGEEGPTSDSAVLETRLKQIRNFLLLLFVSLGIPVLNMGDECGLSTGGSTLHSGRHPYDWTYLGTTFSLQITQFIAFLSSLRMRRSDLLQRRTYHKVENIEWCGDDQSEPKWDDPSCKFLALILKAEKDDKRLSSDKGDMFIVFNASDVQSTAVLPQVPEGHMWLRLVDTALSFPGFFSNGDDPDFHHFSGLEAYKLKPHSCALFEAKTSSS